MKKIVLRVASLLFLGSCAASSAVTVSAAELLNGMRKPVTAPSRAVPQKPAARATQDRQLRYLQMFWHLFALLGTHPAGQL